MVVLVIFWESIVVGKAEPMMLSTEVCKVGVVGIVYLRPGAEWPVSRSLKMSARSWARSGVSSVSRNRQILPLTPEGI